MDAKAGYAIHYGPGDGPMCGANPVGAHWTDEPEAVVGCDDCLDLATETWPTATSTGAGVSTAGK